MVLNKNAASKVTGRKGMTTPLVSSLINVVLTTPEVLTVSFLCKCKSKTSVSCAEVFKGSFL